VRVEDSPRLGYALAWAGNAPLRTRSRTGCDHGPSRGRRRLSTFYPFLISHEVDEDAAVRRAAPDLALLPYLRSICELTGTQIAWLIFGNNGSP
jgi:hypothetical protein